MRAHGPPQTAEPCAVAAIPRGKQEKDHGKQQEKDYVASGFGTREDPFHQTWRTVVFACRRAERQKGRRRKNSCGRGQETRFGETGGEKAGGKASKTAGQAENRGEKSSGPGQKARS